MFTKENRLLVISSLGEQMVTYIVTVTGRGYLKQLQSWQPLPPHCPRAKVTSIPTHWSCYPCSCVARQWWWHHALQCPTHVEKHYWCWHTCV